ncbi:MAG: hypothetical protein JSR54_08470 [Proteobacteria bacterium]|nr:hypothetical protein [Pseudomonadota bacterium]
MRNPTRRAPKSVRPRRLGPGLVVAGALGLSLAAQADEGPTAAMMAPVAALAEYMRSPPPGRHPTMFAERSVTIVENFPPYLFVGPDAVPHWEAGFRAHLAAAKDSELKVEFGPPQDYSVTGKRVFFTLPTTWSGLSGGKRFVEHGAWSFVLVHVGAEWKVLGYGWGVSDAQLVAP